MKQCDMFRGSNILWPLLQDPTPGSTPPVCVWQCVLHGGGDIGIQQLASIPDSRQSDRWTDRQTDRRRCDGGSDGLAVCSVSRAARRGSGGLVHAPVSWLARVLGPYV